MTFSLDYSTELEIFSIFMITETKGRFNTIFKVLPHTYTIIYTYAVICTETCVFLPCQCSKIQLL